jgi:outer membrane protein TolC
MRIPARASLFLLVSFVLHAAARPGAAQSGEPGLPGVALAPAPSSLSGQSGAQNFQNPFLGSVPSGEMQAEPISLTLSDAIERGLKYNLGLLLAREDTRDARGERWKALADLLPNVTAATSESREQINLAAFGFPSLPGIPQIVGPFDVFDTRAYISQSILDLNAIHKTHEQTEKARAADYTFQNARDVVVLVCANLYLQAVADASRVEAAKAQVKTAQATYDRAADLRKAGVAAGIDVLRAQVELQAQKQRLIFFENDFEKRKLTLARSIGLPIRQEFMLADAIPYAPLSPVSLDEAIERAYQSRGDYQAAMARVKAAESARRAARGEGLPSVNFHGDYGVIGNAPGQSHGTYSLAATLKIPIFEGGRVHGEVLKADAQIAQRKAEADDLRGRIAFEVQTAFLDLRSSGERVEVARSALDLAKQQVAQAQDRFAAGVVNSLEVVQAQDALATADENFISSLYTFNVAKASLARALGVAAESYQQFIGGKP